METKSQGWITKNFESLVDKYPNKYIAVVNDKVVSSGMSAKDVEEKAKRRYPDKMPSVILIPKKEDLACLL